MNLSSPTIERLEEQIRWYSESSHRNRVSFKTVKLLQIMSGAAIPLLSSQSWVPSWLPGTLGALIVLCEAVQSLNQYQPLWLSHRSACERLKQEKFLWSAKAGPYALVEDPTRLLAERIESVVGGEHAGWVTLQTDKSGLSEGQQTTKTVHGPHS